MSSNPIDSDMQNCIFRQINVQGKLMILAVSRRYLTDFQAEKSLSLNSLPKKGSISPGQESFWRRVITGKRRVKRNHRLAKMETAKKRKHDKCAGNKIRYGFMIFQSLQFVNLSSLQILLRCRFSLNSPVISTKKTQYCLLETNMKMINCCIEFFKQILIKEQMLYSLKGIIHKLSFQDKLKVKVHTSAS